MQRRLAIVIRWLHVYLSMASFAIVFFFAVTGLTLNHPERFAGTPVTTQTKGEITPGMAREAIIETLRRRHQVKGALSDYRADAGQIAVSFKGPAYAADAFIDRGTGRYELNVTTMGWVAVWNDLHKGRDTGAVWAMVIDVSAVLLVLVSVSGAALLWYVQKRRVPGYFAAGAGTVAAWVLFRLWVP